MKKIKIVIIQNSIAPYRVPLFRLLAQDSNIDLMVIQLTKIEPHRIEWHIPQCTHFASKIIKGFSYSRNYEEHVRINPSLLIELLREKPKVIIIGGFSFASLLSIMVKKIINARVILWFEGTQYTERSISQFRNLIRKFIAEQVDAFIVASKLSKDYIKLKFPNSKKKAIFTAYNNVDNYYIYECIDKFKKDKIRYDILKNKFGNGNRIILYIGQLISRKGVVELLHVLNIIKETSTNISLLLLGNGPLKRFLQDYCNKNGLMNVFFEGFVGQDKIPNYLAIADVFILISHWDCNPLVIFEALAAGLPIIASYRVGNVPEFVKDNYNGFVVDPFNTDQVADRIIKILNDPDLQKKFSKNSKRLSEKSNYEDSYRTFKKAIFHVMGYDS